MNKVPNFDHVMSKKDPINCYVLNPLKPLHCPYPASYTSLERTKRVHIKYKKVRNTNIQIISIYMQGAHNMVPI